jgi:hypothetical protein
MPPKGDDFGAMRALALVGQLGLVFAIPVVAGAMAGAWLDKQTDAGVLFLLAGLAAGLLIGGFGAYRIIIREINWKP